MKGPCASICFRTALYGLALAAILIIGQPAVQAASMQAVRPLGEVLNADGMLNVPPGTRGSFDARGWILASGQDQSPRFSPASIAGDEKWATNFGPRGTNGLVRALVADGSGNIYVGGEFRAAGNIIANNVAKFNVATKSWTALGNGFNWPIYALALDGNGNLYAGGELSQICGNPACNSGNTQALHVAMWNSASQSWSALGNGLKDVAYPPAITVNALAVDSSNHLYAGGSFTRICSDAACSTGTTANRMAEWTSGGWVPVGNGLSGTVYALAADGSTIYAGGDFSSVCGNSSCNSGNVTVNYLAQSNGGAWTAVHFGVLGTVHALAVDGSHHLYVGGSIYKICNSLTCNPFASVGGIAEWTGSTWVTFNNGLNGTVNALAADGNTVYAGGSFDAICGSTGCSSSTPANHIAAWNNGGWSALGAGVDNAVFAIAVSGGNVLAGGDFLSSGGTVMSYLADWNGSAWSGLGSGDGASDRVESVAIDGNGNVYAGGDFRSVGSVMANHVAKWNISTHSWSTLGNGVNNSVYAFAVDSSNNVYVGGGFDEICGDPTCTNGNVSAEDIAKWSPSTGWSVLGFGLDNDVDALTLDSHGTLYAGGAFSACADPACNSHIPGADYIAKWENSTWSALANGLDDEVVGLAVDSHDNLIAGGRFKNVCGNPACDSESTPVNHVARWSNNAWSPLGNGVDGDLYAVAVDRHDNVYVGGLLTNVCGNGACNSGNTPANHIAKWASGGWSTVGNGVDNWVFALAVDSANKVYAGGDLGNLCGNAACNSGNQGANYISVWDGAAWSTLGSGTNWPVQALAAKNGSLFAGGYFGGAGGRPSSYFGQYNISQPLYLPLLRR